MADIWELILHHDYRARPGIIFDESPGQGSHGSVERIPDGAFLVDGARPGSGAIRFGPFHRIVVAPRRGWDRLGGVRAEALIRLDDEGSAGGFIVDGFTFNFQVSRTSIIVVLRNASTERHYRSPHIELTDSWHTAGFVFDGFATIAFTLDGAVVGTTDINPREPILGTTEVHIGNEVRDDHAFHGLIDEVRVWRLNPFRVNDEFNDRPMDPHLEQCWRDWGSRFRDALAALAKANPECLDRIFGLIGRATQTGLGDALVSSPESRGVLLDASERYRRYWTSGDLDGVGDALSRLISDLNQTGWDARDNTALQELLVDPCWQDLLSRLSPIDCDPQYTDMIQRLGRG